jgi:hypothetical protein
MPTAEATATYTGGEVIPLLLAVIVYDPVMVQAGIVAVDDEALRLTQVQIPGYSAVIRPVEPTSSPMGGVGSAMPFWSVLFGVIAIWKVAWFVISSVLPLL